jgi:2-polyprenyl-3-methyl-5-hydroxy-6-metoxy-1,4-benzoquinol methylase
MNNINCPLCGASHFNRVFPVLDYTVSRETFDIVACENCEFKITSPRPEEIQLGRYYDSEDYVSHSDTNSGWINKLYKLVRTVALIQKRNLINGFGGLNKTLLDIGCGTGAFLNVMAKNHWTVTGIEPNLAAREKAKRDYGLTVHEESLLKKGLGAFDVITLWHVLEHVYHLEERVMELKNHMKITSTLVVAVPNCESSDARFYKEFWAAYDVPRHLYHFTPRTMAKLMENNGLEIIKKHIMPFDAFYVAMLSEKYKNNKQNIFGAVYQGMKSLINATRSVDNCSSIIYIIKLKV